MAVRDELEGAFKSRDLVRLVALMDEGVVWRGVPTLDEYDDDEMHDGHEGQGHEHPHVPICRTRDEVRDLMQGFLDQGGDADPVVFLQQGDSVAVEVRPRPGDTNVRPVPPQLFQVMTFRGGRIVLIQDFVDRESALAALG